MKSNYMSFLIECDEELNIVNTYWYFPVYLISSFQKNLRDLFLEDEIELIKKSVDNIINNIEEPYKHTNPFTLKSPQVKVSLYLISNNGNVVILGVEDRIYQGDSFHQSMEYLIYQFMNVIKDLDKNLITKNERTIQLQFNQIQGLNNNLLNTKRQLEKANSELSRLNSDLKNRLVEDTLTGLVSRYQYRDEIQLTINKAPNQLGIFTFLDIDDFKSINDTYGHRAGDEFLVEFANRLKSVSFENPVCIRISGDEFGLYLHGYQTVHKDHIHAIWQEIQMKILSKPIKVKSEFIDVYCSAGMAIYNMDTDDIFDLIEYADFAMYQAKKSGKNSYKQFIAEEYFKVKNKS